MLHVMDLTDDQVGVVLEDSIRILEPLHNFSAIETEPRMRTYVEERGFAPGQVFGIMRAAITGQKVSPPLFESMEIIGKDKVLERLSTARERIMNPG